MLFGVYELLTRLGCRFFGPLEENVPVLEDAELSIPAMEVSESPTMKWRGLELIAGADPAVVDWMAKVKLNVGWPERYRTNPDLSVSPASMKESAVPEMKQRGMTIFWGGHVIPILFSTEKYSDHPQYFAQIGKKRLDPALRDAQRAASSARAIPRCFRSWRKTS